MIFARRMATGAVILVLMGACRDAAEPVPGIIPRPASITSGEGVFSVPEAVTFEGAEDNGVLSGLAAQFGSWTGTTVAFTDSAATIAFAIDAAYPHPEGYRLEVSPEGIRVFSQTPAGAFYALQSLRQLWHRAEEGTIPAMVIEDAPRFPYRGMMLDVGRHTYPPDFIKRFIDLLALHKMNTFHWHLTEDQGWRIEIEQYPRLTEVGAYRRETMVAQNFDPYLGDGTRYGGFFTQDEVRDIVAYAAERFITVIPEIEMPGHSTAALAAYPELGCHDGPYEVSTTWGVHEDIYCPHEETFAFLENVLREVMDLFPSRYIHIGGDEAPKRQWEQSEVAQAVMQREGLADEDELQSYFIRRIQQFLNDHGRQLIGWDEILEGGLAPGPTVMSWRGMDGGIAAARQGHDVIMTPTSHVYFDYYQGPREHEPLAIGGFLPLERVYELDPVPDVLAPNEEQFIRGVQGNVWTEYIQTADHVEYMAFPRAAALAEVAWSPESLRDWTDFTRRLPAFLSVLDDLDVNYRVPAVSGLDEDIVTLDEVTEVLLSTVSAGTIRYTTDGTDPTPASPVYDGPVEVAATDSGTVVSARVYLPSGRSSPLARARVLRTTLRDPSHLVPDNPGLLFSYFNEGRIDSVDDLAVMRPTLTATRFDIGLPDEIVDENFGMAFQGFLEIPADGLYRFVLRSDDGSVLSLNGDVIIDHDGYHGFTGRRATVGLGAGWHRFELQYFQGGGGLGLELEVTRNGELVPLVFGHS